MSLIDRVLDHARSTGAIPDDAQVFVDGVEFTGTGSDLLDALGYVDAHVKVSVRLRPSAEIVNVTLSVPSSEQKERETCPDCHGDPLSQTLPTGEHGCAACSNRGTYVIPSSEEGV